MNQNEDAQRILIRGALIVTLDADDRILPVDDILIEDGLISAIGEISPEVAESCDRIIDGTNRLVMPGLVNAHTHSPLSVVHGAYDLLNHRASMWLFQAYTANRTPPRSLCQYDAQLHRNATQRDHRNTGPFSRTGLRPRKTLKPLSAPIAIPACGPR